MSHKEIWIIIWLVLMFNTILGMYGALKVKKLILKFDPMDANWIGIQSAFYDRSPKESYRFVLFLFKNKWKLYPRSAWMRFHIQRTHIVTQVVLMLVLMIMMFTLRIH